MKKILSILSLILLLFIGLFGCNVVDKLNDIKDNIIPPVVDNEDINDEENPIDDNVEEQPTNEDNEPVEDLINKDGKFTSKDEVALYIYVYGILPSNYRTKSEVSGHISNYWTKENLLSIGGDVFYNREGLLPFKNGRTYFEADINYRGQLSRGRERIVFSNDGLIFYTDDHYESFIEYDTEVKSWK